MKEKLVEAAKHEYSEKQRLTAMLPAAVFFLLILPITLIAVGDAIDRWLHWQPMLFDPINLILAVVFLLTGLFFGMWSIVAQFIIGRGTPVPLMATQKLIVQPPFTYCRNPMTLGTIVAYLGVAILFGSIGSVLLVLLGGGLLLTYIKQIEEKELELRFGQDYLEYKKQTPFLIPRFWRKS